MACATSSCHPLYLRSPRASVRVTMKSAASRFLRTLRAATERFARERLRHAARDIDQHVLDKLAAADPEAARELRDLFGL